MSFRHVFLCNWREMMYNIAEENFSSLFIIFAQFVRKKCVKKHSFFCVSLLEMQQVIVTFKERHKFAMICSRLILESLINKLNLKFIEHSIPAEFIKCSSNQFLLSIDEYIYSSQYGVAYPECESFVEQNNLAAL